MCIKGLLNFHTRWKPPPSSFQRRAGTSGHLSEQVCAERPGRWSMCCAWITVSTFSSLWDLRAPASALSSSSNLAGLPLSGCDVSSFRLASRQGLSALCLASELPKVTGEFFPITCLLCKQKQAASGGIFSCSSVRGCTWERGKLLL